MQIQWKIDHFRIFLNRFASKIDFLVFFESCQWIIQKPIEIWSIFEKTAVPSYINGTFDSYGAHSKKLQHIHISPVLLTIHRDTQIQDAVIESKHHYRKKYTTFIYHRYF